MNRTSMSTYSLSSYIKNILKIMDCSSFKTIHELGLDPCERGRFISSIILTSILIYNLCTQGSSYYSLIYIYIYNYYIDLLIYVIKY